MSTEVKQHWARKEVGWQIARELLVLLARVTISMLLRGKWTGSDVAFPLMVLCHAGVHLTSGGKKVFSPLAR